LRWFDHWLKGIDNGVDREPPVRIFIMGGGDAHRTPEGRLYVGGHWRGEQTWPPQRAVPSPYYLREHGGLSASRPGEEPPTTYQFDPHHPVPTLGGNVSSHNAPPSHHNSVERPGDSENLMEQGAYDQRCRPEIWTCDDARPLSARNDVLVFETAPLDRDVEVTGRLIVNFWASSDAPDTDFTAKLVDVDECGCFARNLTDGILRLRYRNSLEKPELATPGEIYQITVDAGVTANVFLKGHRIRIEIASSNFPRFDRNPNTGGSIADETRLIKATQTIYHGRQHPSRLDLMVM
jgi:hypothetical protein